jgi:hypothetical protein
MISIDTASLWREAFNLWRTNDFDWKIYSSEDIKYLNDNTSTNLDINPIEEIFFNTFSLNKINENIKEVIFNQGEILDYLNKNTSTKFSKFDIKDIFTKNNIEYSSHRNNDYVKKGVKLYVKDFIENQENIDIPF